MRNLVRHLSFVLYPGLCIFYHLAFSGHMFKDNAITRHAQTFEIPPRSTKKFPFPLTNKLAVCNALSFPFK
jgi:hypothetical protein